jgi:hypothetical protein
MADQAQDETQEMLVRLERELARLKGGLELLGVKACCWCQKLFRAFEPGSLFDGGELVCYGCVRDWWPARSPTVAVAERDTIEHKLVHWLLKYHGAKVIRDEEKLPPEDRHQGRLVAACEECEGKGVWAGAKCHFCGGRGSLWLVIPKQPASNT